MASGVAADQQLERLLADDWRDAQRRHPIAASLAGQRAYDDRWDDLSLAAAAGEDAHRGAVLDGMAAIGRKNLSPAARLNYDLYDTILRDERAAYALDAHLFAISPRGGVQTYAAYADQLPFATVHDYEQWQRRLEAYPAAVEQTLERLRAAVERGLLWPRRAMDRLPAQLDRMIAAPESSAFFAPYRALPPSIGASDATRLRAAAAAAIEAKVNPALQTLRAFVVDTYLPAAPENAGLAHLPGGDELYAHFVRSETTTNLEPDAIHRLGLAEVARIRAAMEELVPELGYGRKPLAEIFRALREDPANYHTTPEALLTAYRAIAKRIDPELVRVFRTLPRLPYGVIPIPEATAPDTTTAYYFPGALDGSRAGLYYVNLYRPEQRPIYEMMVLSVHESVPGHHLQIARAQELTGLPDFRRSTLSFTAYVEGWGLYSESLGGELGLYDDPKSRFGALTYDMWRAVRLVVDTGMHAQGWSRERAIAYFLDNAAKTPLDVENEVDRYLTMPGQALAYKIGQLKILDLRRRAEAALGAAFDLRDFHEVILDQGALPLDLLERRVDEWLAAR
ncbi:MAG TPA: DUF885 domain-containing protein [Candidatus Elarobacter sp.]